MYTFNYCNIRYHFSLFLSQARALIIIGTGLLRSHLAAPRKIFICFLILTCSSLIILSYYTLRAKEANDVRQSVDMTLIYIDDCKCVIVIKLCNDKLFLKIIASDGKSIFCIVPAADKILRVTVSYEKE